jgi:DNA polymerase sigma
VCYNSSDAPCDTYFYHPSTASDGTPEKATAMIDHKTDVLRSFAAQNKETTAQLVVEFFRYYAWIFDFKRSTVSVREGTAIPKIVKAERDAWGTTDRLSVEDPFETGYDVAHVIKATQMAYLRKELLRAFTLCARMCNEESLSEGGKENEREGGIERKLEKQNCVRWWWNEKATVCFTTQRDSCTRCKKP